MACFHPLQAWRPKSGAKLVFNIKDGWADRPVKVPCGQCIGCRLERSRVWAVRCMHEASLYSDNCFVTITYSDENIPPGDTLVVADLQKFMKRLRRRYGDGIRFYACGEYGERYGRPHYHICLFNHDFPDKRLWRQNFNGNNIYRSAALEELWPFGLSEIGDVTFESAAYVARYIMKKVTGDVARNYYEFIDPVSGEVSDRLPDFTVMSRRPGVGRFWVDKFANDVYSQDFVLVNGVKSRAPRYYDNVFELGDPVRFKAVRAARYERGRLHVDDNTPDRLRVREQVVEAKARRLIRGLS